MLTINEAGALIQKGVDDARMTRAAEPGAAGTQPAAAQPRISTTNDSESSSETMAGDDAAQLDRQLKWIQDLKDVGALSSEEYEQLRLRALQDHPNAKPE